MSNETEGQQRTYPLTTAGLAERFVDQHAREVRYVASWKTWIAWGGARWTRSSDARIHALVKATVRSIDREVSEEKDDTRRQDLREHARRAENARSMGHILWHAHREEKVQAQPEDLDADPWLLNVQNGTVNLRDGSLGPHDPADLITKVAPVRYDPEARSELWDDFVRRALPDPELRAFVQRAVGYSITGDTGEEVLFVVHGPTATSKSKFVGAIQEILGDYAKPARFETFLRRPGVGGARSDLVELVGARFVPCSEVARGRPIAEDLVKAATGGDSFPIRGLYAKPFTFTPRFKLWLATNDRPEVRHDDDALWRRIKEVPFVEQVPEAEMDRGLKAKLAQPAVQAAILAWAAQGCLDWRKDGLRPPEAVKKATSAYQRAMDSALDFVREKVRKSDSTLTSAQIHKAAVEWAEEAGLPRPSKKSLGKALKEVGFSCSRTSSSRGWWVSVIDDGHQESSSGLTAKDLGRTKVKLCAEGDGPPRRQVVAEMPDGTFDWVEEPSEPSRRDPRVTGR